MAITDLTDKILSDARERVSDIHDDTERKLAAIDIDTEKQVRTLTATIQDETEKRLADNERRVISTAKQEAKLELDTQKRSILESVFDAALKELSDMPEQKYEQFCTSLLKELPKDLVGVLKTAPKYAAASEKALTSSGLTLEIEKDASVPTGFIIVGDNFEYNYTLAKIIADKKSKLEISVADTLFG